MANLRRFLLLLLMGRLLLPPGICLCQEGSPATRLFLSVIDPQRELPPPSPEEDDDHDPGCPASQLAAGMGLHLPLVSLLPPLPDALLELPELILPAPPEPHPTASTFGPSPPPLPIYLQDCAVLI